LKLVVFNLTEGGGKIALNPAHVIALDPVGPSTNIYTSGIGGGGKSLMWSVVESFDKVLSAVNAELGN
jgi:hypothetical protein